MKRAYELPVVFRILSSEDELNQAIDQVIAWIENSTEGIVDAGQVTRIDRTSFGRRRLAYEIEGQRDGYYVFFYANMEPAHIAELELNLRLYDPVLRYLLLVDEAVDEDSARAE